MKHMNNRRLSARYKIEFKPARNGRVFCLITLWRKNHYYASGRNHREAQRLAWQKYVNDSKRKPLTTVNTKFWQQCAAHPVQKTTCAGCGVEFTTRWDYERHLKIISGTPGGMGFAPAPEEIVCSVEYERQHEEIFF
ncbi:MAG: hypothetical protein ACYTBJ_26300 [Planctomycetota bacterium]|jgi:hypothetical protein